MNTKLLPLLGLLFMLISIHSTAAYQYLRCVTYDALTVNPAITEQLLQISRRAIDLQYNDDNGFVYDDEGREEVRDTAYAALLYLELGELERAERSLNAVIDSQINDENDPGYGGYPQTLGETSFQNWPGFIGTTFLIIYERHQEKLSSDTLRRLEVSVELAATNITHQVSQISVDDFRLSNTLYMYSFVLIRTGEILDNPDFFDTGKELWSLIVQIATTEGLYEYNTPNYYKVDLYALGAMADIVEDQDIRREANCLRRILWWDITQRWHEGLSQIAGPYSRGDYGSELLRYFPGSSIGAFLYRDSQGRLPTNYPGESETFAYLQAVLPTVVSRSWPDAWIDLAMAPRTDPSQFRQLVDVTIASGTLSHHIATTYLAPDVAIGTVNFGVISSGARPLVVHALDDSNEVGLFRLNGSSGIPLQVRIVQNERSILAVIFLPRYQYAETTRKEVYFQFAGPSQPELGQLVDSLFASQSTITWMDTFMNLRFYDVLPEKPVSIDVRSESEGDFSQIVLSVEAESTEIVRAIDKPNIPLVVMTAYIGGPISLEPVQFINQDGLMILSWVSPDGDLTLELSRTNGTYTSDYVDGVAITAHPINPP